MKKNIFTHYFMLIFKHKQNIFKFIFCNNNFILRLKNLTHFSSTDLSTSQVTNLQYFESKIL